MAKGRRFTSHDGVTSAGAGDSQQSRQHTTIGLWVEATNLDSASDTLEVRVEASPDDTHYAPIDSAAPAVTDALSYTAGDLTQSAADNSVYVGYKVLNNVSVEYVRSNITSFTDDAGGDLEVTTYIFIGGWTGSGKSFAEREDIPTRV